jgi:SulP family sulfate permease
VRVDESLFFANARYLEEQLTSLAAENRTMEHLVLICSAINSIDASALESLESINQQLWDMGVTFHLSEVKGPVMDRLKRSHFLEHLKGRIYLSHYQALQELDPAVIKRGEEQHAALRAVVEDMQPTQS